MNNKHSINTPESRTAAAEKRNAAIALALENGARVNVITAPLKGDERETVVNIGSDGAVCIDTTIPRDMNSLIKKGYHIDELTYYKGKAVGALFKASRKQVSFRKAI